MIRSLFAAGILAALPVAAQAQPLSYGYVEAGVARADQYGDSLDGYALKAAIPFGERWYGTIDYSRTQFDEGRSIDLIKQAPAAFGVGYRLPVGDSTDLVFEGAYLALRSEILGDDFVNSGARGAFGVRSKLASHFELELKATVTGVEEFDTLFGVYAGALISFNENWGVGLGYHVNAYDFSVFADGGDVDVATIGLRYTY
jgi:opacity protein-like surface antigen